jgi:2'-5' RNA ligase
MAESNEYAIIYLLPEPARSYHLNLWAKVEHAFHLTGMAQPKAPPHFTLKYSFEAMDVAVVEQALEAFCATTRPTPWSIRGYNHFITPGNFVIFLEVVPTPAVRAAHANLLERLRSIPWMRWEQYDGADLHYHATIAHRGLAQANFEDVWAFVNAQPPPDFDLHFDNLALLKINEDIDTVIKTYRLAD